MLNAENTPFDALGGEGPVLRLASRFYDVMEAERPELARIHACDAEGRVSKVTRERFGLFLVGWLGGPQTYHEKHGHPRLRMRHGHVAIDLHMRDAWLHCMRRAMDEEGIDGEVRHFLDARFAEVADFLRNRAG